MLKILHQALTLFVIFFVLKGNCQSPVIVVQSFEYVWQRDFAAMGNSTSPRIIIPMADSPRILMRNSFARAIQKRWNISLPEVSWSVKRLPVLSNKPKFNTGLKDKQAGKWYLFLQVFDKGNFPGLFEEVNDTFSTTLELKCKVINGANDSVVHERTLTVNINKEPAPPDQVLLKRLPGYPPYFIKSFDSIASWLFQIEEPVNKYVRLRPACVFNETTIGSRTHSQLSFQNDNETIRHLTYPEFLLHTPPEKYEKIDAKHNIAGNTAKGTLTLLTGIRTNKRRIFQYRADFPFEEGDSVYHCLIDYIEVETAEQERERTNDNGIKSSTVRSDSYRLLGRYIDTAFLNVITLDKDTVAEFTIKYTPAANEEAGYNKMWDGTDSSTVMTLPAEWKNTNKGSNVLISGNLDGNSFSLQSSRETRVNEIRFNNQLAMIMYGNKPVRAFVFQPVSSRQLKIFTIICSLPYSYFNYDPGSD